MDRHDAAHGHAHGLRMATASPTIATHDSRPDGRTATGTAISGTRTARRLQPRVRDRHRPQPAFVAVEAFYGWRADSLALLADAGHNLSDVARPRARLGRRASPAGCARRAPHLRLEARVDPRRVRQRAAAAGRDRLARLGGARPAARRRRRADRTLMVVAGDRHRRQPRHRAALPARPPRRPQRARRVPAHGRRRAVSAGVVVTGALALWLGWPWLDPAASLVIAFVILLGTWGLFRDSLHLLFDGVPGHRPRRGSRRAGGAARRRPGQRPACLGHRHHRDGADRAPVMPGGHPDDRSCGRGRRGCRSASPSATSPCRRPRGVHGAVRRRRATGTRHRPAEHSH